MISALFILYRVIVAVLALLVIWNIVREKSPIHVMCLGIVLYPLILGVARHRKPVIENLDYFSEIEDDAPLEAHTHHEMIETESDIDPAHPFGPPVTPPKHNKKKDRPHRHRHFFE